MTRTALVSGAAGFLGSHLTETLIQEGWSVIGIDNLATGRRENLSGLRQSSAFKLIIRDLSHPTKLPPVDAVFHLASPASPPHYLKDPIGTLEVNGMGTAQLLAHAHACGARMLFTSTSEVYGDPEVHPQPETYWGHVNPIGPRSCYDEGKRYAEALCVAWQRQRGSDVRVARLFNTFGPRMSPDDGRVVSNFLVQGWRGQPLTVQGSGTQTRSFCYVSDVVRGLIRLFQAEKVDGPVNLGNPGTEMTILQLAERVQALTGGKSQITFIPRAVDDPEKRRPDISKAQKLLGWSPQVPFEEGLRLTSEHFHRWVLREGR